MCDNEDYEEQIAKMTEHLIIQLEETNIFSDELQNMHEKTILWKTNCQRQYDLKVQEIQNFEYEMDALDFQKINALEKLGKVSFFPEHFHLLLSKRLFSLEVI